MLNGDNNCNDHVDRLFKTCKTFVVMMIQANYLTSIMSLPAMVCVSQAADIAGKAE